MRRPYVIVAMEGGRLVVVLAFSPRLWLTALMVVMPTSLVLAW